MPSTETTMFDLLAIISKTLDLVGGPSSQHGMQVAYGAWRLAEHCGLSRAEQERIALAGLIHDIGVSSSHVREKLVRDIEICPRLAWDHAERGRALLNEVEYAAGLSDLLGFHHHRYGGPNPDGVIGQDIPVGARILHLLDRVSVLIEPGYILHQRDQITQRIREFSGSHFDPALVRAFADLSSRAAFWLDLSSGCLENLMRTYLQRPRLQITHEDIYATCSLLAKVIDDKSPFTHSHSQGVARVARELAKQVEFDGQGLRDIELAGLIHDLGKLAVPDAILDKPGKLSSNEMAVMHQHTYHTYRILSNNPAFADIAQWGAHHHEHLSGTGYPFGLSADGLDKGCQIMAVADIFQALNQDRPYRAALAPRAVEAILVEEARHGRISESIVGLVLEDYDHFAELA